MNRTALLRRAGGFASLTLVLLCGAAPAQDAPAAKAPAPTLDTLAWIAGHWRVETEHGMVEEIWLPPRGNLMLGLNRTVRDTKSNAQFEFLRIVSMPHGIAYLASPGGREPTPFVLAEADERHAVFTNPTHDFPKRIEYRLEAKDRLVASIAGDEPGPSWTFARVAEVR